MDSIEINGATYIPASQALAGPPTEHRIVVADRGWVFVGATQQQDDGSLVITNANCIRVWGTDESHPGLGYIAANGPTGETKLDPSGTVRIPTHAVVLTLDTNAARWA